MDQSLLSSSSSSSHAEHEQGTSATPYMPNYLEHSELQRDLDSLLRDFSSNSDAEEAELEDSLPLLPPAPAPNGLACGDCGRGNFPTLKRLRAHQQTHRPRALACNTCGKAFRWPCSLKRHVENVHAHGGGGGSDGGDDDVEIVHQEHQLIQHVQPIQVQVQQVQQQQTLQRQREEVEDEKETNGRNYYCFECGIELPCITLLAKHVRKAHGFAISIRSPYLDTLRSPCCRKNQCTGNDKRGSGLAPSVMMADAKTAIKTEPAKSFSCLFCHITVRKEDLLDHQMVHMKDMGRGGKLSGHPQPVNHAVGSVAVQTPPTAVVPPTISKTLKKRVIPLKTEEDEVHMDHHPPEPAPSRHHSQQQVQPMSGNSSSSSTPSTAASGGSSHQVLGIPDPATGQNGAVVDVNSVLAQIWAQNPDQVPVLVAGASVISYCKSCWKVCQMEIPPGKVELDLSEFRCFSCAGAEVTGMNGAGNGEEESDQANNDGDEVVSVDWHRPASGVPVQQVYHQNEIPGGSRPQRARHEHRILIP